MYTAAMVVVAAFLVGGVNLALSGVLGTQGTSTSVVFESDILSQLGVPLQVRLEDAVSDAEAQARAQALADLRTVSLVGLTMLVPISLLVSWIVAGRVLRPIDRIAAVARDIEANDLSRRINLTGPDDELRRLADTFDGMLDRIDDGVRAQRTLIEDASTSYATLLPSSARTSMSRWRIPPTSTACATPRRSPGGQPTGWPARSRTFSPPSATRADTR